MKIDFKCYACVFKLILELAEKLGSDTEHKKALANDPEFAKNWDEKLGDRMVKLVFIGRKMDKAKICADLDACTVDPSL